MSDVLDVVGIPVEGDSSPPWNPSTDVVVVNNNLTGFVGVQLSTPAAKKTTKSDPASTLMGVISLLKTHSQQDIQRVLRATASYFGCEEEADV